MTIISAIAQIRRLNDLALFQLVKSLTFSYLTEKTNIEKPNLTYIKQPTFHLGFAIILHITFW